MPRIVDLGGGRYKLVVSLGFDPDTGRRIRKSHTFRAGGVRERDRMVAKIETEIRSQHAKQEIATVAQAADEWWAYWLTKDRSPGTVEGYQRHLNRIKADLGHRQLDRLPPGALDTWYAGLLGHNGQRLAPASVRRVHAVLHQVLEHAHRNEWAGRNPARFARLPESRPKETRFAPNDVVGALIRAAAARHEMHGRLLLFAALTGMRRGEIAALRWSRIDLDRSTARVHPEEGSVLAIKGGLVIKSPKGRRGRTVPLHEAALATVQMQMGWQRDEASQTGVTATDPFLWAMEPPYARPMAPSTFTAWFTQARTAVGPAAADVKLHGLRHWFGSTMAAAAVPGPVIQQLMGHANLATTNIYLHAEEGVGHAMVARLPELGKASSS